MRILLIVASGKSTRFGGFPKAFCKIGEKMNVENTIEKAKDYFDKVYIGVNRNTYAQFVDKVDDCEMFSIITGQGDAHSILKCLAYVREHETEIEKLIVCWGDAVFVDSCPFEQLLEKVGNEKVAVACAVDEKPYAWFDVNNQGEIVKSHFAKEDGLIPEGIHDQSLFLIEPNYAWMFLNEYREILGIPYDNDESRTDICEMKLLLSFEFLFQKDYEKAKCIDITPGKVLSFNTLEELEQIKRKLQNKDNDN